MGNRAKLQQGAHLQPVQEELPQQVLPKGSRLVQKATAQHIPVLAYGLTCEQLPHCITDPREAFQALHVDQQVADPSPDILTAPEGGVLLQTGSEITPENPGENTCYIKEGGVLYLSIRNSTCKGTCRAQETSGSQ